MLACSVGSALLVVLETLASAERLACTFSGRAHGAQPALISGAVGVAWAVDGHTKVTWDLAIRDGRVVHIDMIAAPDSLRDLDLALLDP